MSKTLNPFLSVHSQSHLQIIWLSSTVFALHIFTWIFHQCVLSYVFSNYLIDSKSNHIAYNCKALHQLLSDVSSYCMIKRVITFSKSVRLFTIVYCHLSLQIFWSRARVITSRVTEAFLLNALSNDFSDYLIESKRNHTECNCKAFHQCVL